VDTSAPYPLPRGTAPGTNPPQLPEFLPPATPPSSPERPAAPPSPERPDDRSLLRRAGGAIVAALLLLAKFGKAALLLVGKGKFLVTAGSMLVSIAAYALIWGWKFGAVFVALLFIHEIGHVIQLRREGVQASAPMFIPFLGAFVAMKEMPKDAGAEARVGLAGPVLGSIGCLIPVVLWQITGNEFWQAGAFIGIFLNLFNLLPVLPLDGGRAMAALSSWIWAIGFVLFLGVLVFFPSPILILIVLLGGMETWRRWKQRKTPEAQEYNRVSRGTRIAVAAVYLGLVIALGAGLELTHLERTLSDV
jgi:Zn-dependent protease